MFNFWKNKKYIYFVAYSWSTPKMSSGTGRCEINTNLVIDSIFRIEELESAISKQKFEEEVKILITNYKLLKVVYD